MFGILIGTIVGLVGIGGGIAFLVLRKSNSPTKPIVEDNPETPPTNLTPMELKLRNALYECERQMLSCEEEIEQLCQYQQELLRDVGKPSYMEIADKPLFFKYINPIKNDTRYYYERDVDANANPSILEQTRQILENYAVHIALYQSKRELFKKLLQSHQENLDRVQGIHRQNDQLNKLREHRDRLDKLDNEKQVNLETNSIKAQFSLEAIEEELTFQEECFEQYVKLTEEYNNATELSVYRTFKEKVDKIITQLEDKDLRNKQ